MNACVCVYLCMPRQTAVACAGDLSADAQQCFSATADRGHAPSFQKVTISLRSHEMRKEIHGYGMAI